MIPAALAALSRPENIPIRLIFGRALEARSREPVNHSCGLFGLLSRDGWPIDQFNGQCADYLKLVDPENAQRKCWSDLRGCIASPVRDFNGGCADFFAEINAVRVLSVEQYHSFFPITGRLQDGTTADYSAVNSQGEHVYVEVKNIRSNRTLADIFCETIQQFESEQPGMYPYRLCVDYPSDEPPTGEQVREIEEYVRSLKGRIPSANEQLHLGEFSVRIGVEKGEPYAFMTRGIGPDTIEPLNKARFIGKVRSKAEKAATQMCGTTHRKVLVINYDTPSAEISLDFVESAKAEMLDVFQGNVVPYFLHYGNACFVG